MEGEPRRIVWTPEDLARIGNGHFFAKGIFVDDETGFNIQGTGNVVRWVAVKGDVEDWSIYYQNPSEGYLVRDFPDVAENGIKLHHPLWILKLVPSTGAMMKLYRHEPGGAWQFNT